MQLLAMLSIIRDGLFMVVGLRCCHSNCICNYTPESRGSGHDEQEQPEPGSLALSLAYCTRKSHHLHKGGASSRSLTYGRDGQCLAAAHSDGSIRVWKAATGQLLA